MIYEDEEPLEAVSYDDSTYDEMVEDANRFTRPDDMYYSMKNVDSNTWVYNNYGNPMIADIVMPNERIKDE